ncbi:MAG: hypothetical protein WD081_09440 [Gammaproteobacteria bacterium]
MKLTVNEPQGLPEQLRALPGLEPPTRVWAAIAAERGRRARRLRWLPMLGTALAASLVMAVALVTLQRPVDAPAPTSEVARLVAHSQDLDAALTAIAPTTRVLDLQTAGTIVALEDRIAQLDVHLQRASLESPATTELWRQRVDLMEALVGVHATSGQYAF